MKSKSESYLTCLWFTLIWFLKHVVCHFPMMKKFFKRDLFKLTVSSWWNGEQLETSAYVSCFSDVSDEPSILLCLFWSFQRRSQHLKLCDLTKSQRFQYFSSISTKIKCSELLSTFIIQLCTLTVCWLFFHLDLFLF